MKKILFFSLFISLNAFGQSVTISPYQLSRDGGVSNDIIIKNYESEGGSPQIIAYKAGGTKSSPTNTRNYNYLLSLSSGGYSGSIYVESSSIGFLSTEDWSYYNKGSKIFFNTVKNGTDYTAERMVINHDGNVGIGVSTPNEILDVNGRMRLRHTVINNIPYSSGVWMNNSFNSLNYLDGAFHGMKTDTETGIFIGGYWRFWVKSNGNVVNTGFTQLGDNVPAGAAAGANAPAIKTLYLTGTTASSEGGTAIVATGLAIDKILGYTVFVKVNGNLVPPEFTGNTELLYHTFFNDTIGTIAIYNSANQSGSLFSRPFRVLLTYIE